MAGIWFVITVLEAGSASGERKWDNRLCRGFSHMLYIIIKCRGHKACNKIRNNGHMQEKVFVVPFFLMHIFECGCAVTVGRTGSRDLSKFPNTTAKTQMTFPLLQNTWLCECKHNSVGVQDLSPPACFPAIPKKTALAALDKERVSFPLVDSATSRRCTLVLLLLHSLQQTLGASAAFSPVSLPDQFFCCLYLPALSTI